MTTVYGIPVLDPTMAEVFVFGCPMRFYSIVQTFSNRSREEYLCPTGVWDYAKNDWVTLNELGGDDVSGSTTERDKLLVFEDPTLMIGFAQSNAKTLREMYLTDKPFRDHPGDLFVRSCHNGHKKIPKGMYGVAAYFGRELVSNNSSTNSLKNSSKPHYFFIPQEEYDAWHRSSYDCLPFNIWFRIDLERYKEVPCYFDKLPSRKSNRARRTR